MKNNHPLRNVVMGLLVMTGWGHLRNAQAATSPTAVVGKVFEVRLSQNSDCSGGVTVFKSASPTAVDFVANPTLGGGVIPNGTYHCIAIHLSDVVTVTPQANDGANCHAGVAFSQDIFVAGNQSHVSYAPDGSVIQGTGSEMAPSEDDPWVYFTDSNLAASSNSCFLPPFGVCACPNTGPCPIGTVTVTGDNTRTIVVDFDNAVGDFGNGHCELHQPSFTIR